MTVEGASILDRNGAKTWLVTTVKYNDAMQRQVRLRFCREVVGDAETYVLSQA